MRWCGPECAHARWFVMGVRQKWLRLPRMRGRMDRPKAVTAAAHKLARLIYAMLTKGEEYTDRG